MNQTIGQRIKECRKKMGMTQEELAEILYTKKNTISSYESDKIDLKVKTVQDIAKALNTTPGYLLDGGEMKLGEDVLQIVLMLQDMPEGLRKVAVEQVKVLNKLGK